MTTAFDKDLELIFQKLTSDRQVKQALDFFKTGCAQYYRTAKRTGSHRSANISGKTTQPTLLSNAESCRSAGCDHR